MSISFGIILVDVYNGWIFILFEIWVVLIVIGYWSNFWFIYWNIEIFEFCISFVFGLSDEVFKLVNCYGCWVECESMIKVILFGGIFV